MTSASSVRAAAVAAGVTAALLVPVHAADEGWVLERFDEHLTIDAAGTMTALDAIDVDFRGIAHHGIYRDLVYQLQFDQARDRRYEIALNGVTSADGRTHRVRTLTTGDQRRFQIGDPDRTITGKETYRIAYTVKGALNGFSDRDELYWNATGSTWPVRIEDASVVVDAPGDSVERVECFEGPNGSRDPCRSTFTPARATFHATRVLDAGEQLTVVVGLRKGAVADPQPILVARRRSPTGYFDVGPTMWALSGGMLAAVLGGLGTLWWRFGRDRRFVSLHYLSNNRPRSACRSSRRTRLPSNSSRRTS